MAVKILITLEGAEQINSAIEGIKTRGEEMMASLNSLGAGGKSPFGDVSMQLQAASENASKGIDSATAATHGFTEALRVVIPSLRLAGVEVGNFSGFARLATTGATGLAVAITGAVIVALANFEEHLATVQTRLSGLFGSREKGSQAFSALQKSADDLKTSVGGIAPIFEAATTALQRFAQQSQGFKFVALKGADLPAGIAGNIKATTDAITALIKIIRVGGQDEATAEKSAKTFFDTMKNGGKLTADALKQMDPGAVSLIAEAMGRGSITAEQFITEVSLAPIPINKLLEALTRFGPKAQEAFDANAVKSFKDELNSLLNDLGKEFRDLTGIAFSDFVIGEIKAVADGIKTSIEEFKRIRDSIIGFFRKTEVGGADARAAAVAEQNKLKGLQPFKLSDIFGITEAEKNVTDLGDKTKDAATIGAKAWDNVSNSVKKLADDAITAGNQMLQQWQKIQQQTQENKNKWVSPTGTISGPTSPSATMLTPTAPAQTTQTLVAPLQEADNQIRTIWLDLTQWIADSLGEVDLSSLTNALVTPFTAAVPLIRDELLKVENMILEIMREAAAAAGAIQQLNQGGRPGGGGGGFSFREVATGGLIRGPGTPTSDSILAWLSNMEFVQPARAVSYYGLEFMEAIRQLRFPKQVLATGGLAPIAVRIPNFASGGSVTTSAANRSLTIVLDGQRFGLNGPADVVDQLERKAAMSGIASIGRPPGWVR